MSTDAITQDREEVQHFWHCFFSDTSLYEGILVSAQCLSDRMREMGEECHALQWMQECDVRGLHTLDSRFPYRSSNGIGENRYSRTSVMEKDKSLSMRFHALVPQIVEEYKGSFIDQLRCIHFLGMAGNESIMLYPSQARRLQSDAVTRIAGEIRNIPTGFGDYRFNAPSPANLDALLSVYTRKVESLLGEIDRQSVYHFVSFAQYYFAVLHPFYERCGRTSEDLMYLLFEQVGIGKRYISCAGDRASPLAHERMGMINTAVEGFNQKIARHFGLDPQGIHTTPDIYRALTATYFPEQFEQVYAHEPARPYYYAHPLPQILPAYYFLMEALLFDELNSFSLDAPPEHIVQLGQHLQEKGQKEYLDPSATYAQNIRLLDVLHDLSGSPSGYGAGMNTGMGFSNGQSYTPIRVELVP